MKEWEKHLEKAKGKLSSANLLFENIDKGDCKVIGFFNNYDP